jgi:predicted DNA-binding protein
MSTKKDNLPQFKSEDQEADYWDKHSPLDLVDEPEKEEVQVKRVKDRPIAIRLDSQTRIRLETLAAEQGMGPSTLARRIIQQVLENKEDSYNNPDLNELRHVLSNNLAQVYEAKAGYNLLKTRTGKADKSPLLVFRGGKKDLDDFSAHFLERFLANLNIKVITQDQLEHQNTKQETKD